MPFYRHLVAKQESPAKGVTLLALSAEPTETVRKYLLENQVKLNEVYQISLPNSLLQGTPTFLVVNDQGVIERAAIGQLNGSKETEMINLPDCGQVASVALSFMMI